MSNIKDLSLSLALSDKCLSELPKQFRDDCGEYWLEAIVLVKKQNLSQSYAVAKRGADGRIEYKADYGDVSPIAGLISIHPYLYLDKQMYMPYENIGQMRHALAQYIGGDEEAVRAVADIPDTEVQYQLLQIAIESQYDSMSIKDTHQAILDAVGVKPVIKFENEEKNGEGDKNDDAGGVSEPSERSGEEYTGDGDAETHTDNGNADFQSEDAVSAENAQVDTHSEKPKSKCGRPRGSKNTARTK